MSQHVFRLTHGLLVLAGLALLAAPTLAADDLPRRGVLGVQLAPLTDDARQERKLAADAKGAVITATVSGGAAAEGGLKAGDVVTSMGDDAIASPGDISRALRKHVAGDVVPFKVLRGGETLDVKVTLAATPRETGDGCGVEYGFVVSNGQRLRTIVTTPKVGDAKPADAKADAAKSAADKHPGFLFVQGLSCAPTEGVALYTNILYDLSQHGVVTMRVEKPGIGDSEGPPCSEINFEQELDGYRQALKALKARPDVDPERVFLFGHSMGGVMGPLLAAENPVRGIIVYGTAVRTWVEYMLENARRQTGLTGATPDAVEQAVRQETLFQTELLINRRSPAEIREKHPDLAAYFAENMVDDAHIYGRHYTFFQQLGDAQLADAWRKVSGRVLALWGESDFVTSPEDHRLIAEIVNAVHPGHATFTALPGIDHAFSKQPSAQASMQSGMRGDFNPAITETVRTWVLETAKTDTPG